MFRKGQRVVCLSNPYGSMMSQPKPGDEGTITSDGDLIVGVQFGKSKFRCWLVKDGNGRTTIRHK